MARITYGHWGRKILEYPPRTRIQWQASDKWNNDKKNTHLRPVFQNETISTMEYLRTLHNKLNMERKNNYISTSTYFMEEDWLSKINKVHKWHHKTSPLIWKELLFRGSKPFFIGGSSEFLDYCYSYYKFDSFLSTEKYEQLIEHIGQIKKKMKLTDNLPRPASIVFGDYEDDECDINYGKTSYRICISGAGNPMTMYLISGLLDMTSATKCVVKVYIFDEDCEPDFMRSVEKECNYVPREIPSKVVRYVEKVGYALTQADLLIVLDHEPFRDTMSIGQWLNANKKKMKDLAMMINSSALRDLYIIFPNLGPACFNATCLMNFLHDNRNNIVVATSDLGLEILPFASEIAQVPIQNMFCPPVWGFVGINHLVDINTTVHKYNTFDPYRRFTRVKKSSLTIGSLTPELRIMQYLMYKDTTLWEKVAAFKTTVNENSYYLKQVMAVLNLVNLSIFDPNPNYVVAVGTKCNGSFGLTFKGIFSQPSRLVDGEWKPASDYPLPRDPFMSLKYLEDVANYTMKLGPKELPKVIPFLPCCCKTSYYKNKGAWCVDATHSN